MKKIITLVSLVYLVTISLAQSDSVKSKTSVYTSVGLSVSTGNNFLTSSYPSIEGGIMRDNLCLGIVLGRGNFLGMGKSDENISNYFYEGKTTACFPIGSLSGSIIFGYGGYFKTQHMFIEYGGGVSYSCGKLSYGVACTNWDGITYVTPNITINF